MQTIASTQPLIPDQQVLAIPNHTTKYVDVEVTGNRAPYIGWSRSALHSEEGLNPFFVTNSIKQIGGGCMGTLFLPERHFQKQSYPLSIPICFVYAHSNTAVWMIDKSLITGNTAASSTDPKVCAAFRTLYWERGRVRARERSTKVQQYFREEGSRRQQLRLYIWKYKFSGLQSWRVESTPFSA